MTQYEPNAVALDSMGHPARLFTYSPCFTKEQCYKVIQNWSDGHGYKLLCSWIEVSHDSGAKRIIAHKTYRENFFG